jgi:hypothetical protein
MASPTPRAAVPCTSFSIASAVSSSSPAPSPQPRAPSPHNWQAWSSNIESQLRALDEKKQDKGQFLKPEDLRGYLRIADAPKLDAGQFAKLLVGALGVSGPLAAAVIVAGGLAGRRLKRAPLRVAAKRLAATRRSPPATAAERAPEPIAVDSPPPPQRTVPETHYVPVEQDTFAKAHQWASEHVARKYPGATEILQALESLIKQYLAAK